MENFLNISVCVPKMKIVFSSTEGNNEMGGACSSYGGEERRIQGFGGKPKGQRPLGGDRRRWEENIDGSSGSGMWGLCLHHVFLPASNGCK